MSDFSTIRPMIALRPTRLRATRIIPKLPHSLWLTFLVILCQCVHCAGAIDPEDLPIEIDNAITNHAVVVANAALDVSKEMAGRIENAISGQDYERAGVLTRSLASFLDNDEHPASTITVPDIAEAYTAKRKDSARSVFQSFRKYLNEGSENAEAIKTAMDQFVRREKELQQLAEPTKLNKDDIDPEPQLVKNNLGELPRKGSKNGQNPPKDLRKVEQPNQPTTKDKGLLTKESLEDLNQSILQIRNEYMSKFEGATTDLQRERIATKHMGTALQECFKEFGNRYIEYTCELDDCRSIQDENFPFEIKYITIDSSLPISSQGTLLLVTKRLAYLAEAAHGTQFLIRVPVVVAHSSAENAMRQRAINLQRQIKLFDLDLKVRSVNSIKTLPWTADESDLRFGMDHVPSSEKSLDYTSQVDRLESPSSEISFSVKLYAVWAGATIELPKTKE